MAIDTVAPPRRDLRSLLAPAAVAVAAVAAVSYVAAVDPHEPGHYPTCPSLWLTGFYCPGCGSMRAVHDLAHLDIVGALSMNPLTVAVVPWLVWRWVRWVRERAGHAAPRELAPAWTVWTLVAVVIAFTIARNIPFLAPYLAP